MSANTEWAAIVRKLESELAEARCTDPDHYAINAERSEARGLRKAWIKLDDQRQTLERELAEVTKQLHHAVGLLSTTPQFKNQHPEDILIYLKGGQP